ncbi:MAG: hypothetical protein FWE18_03255 [Alphaproteobacteria bacterium]|nr:hypothetical protein [Alphaproteobacteria bacterium]
MTIKIIKLLLAGICFSLLFGKLNAAAVFSAESNAVALFGDFNLAYFNRLPSVNTYDFMKNNQYYSTVGASVENTSLENFTVALVVDVRINNKFYYPENIDKDYYRSLEVNQLYLELKDAAGSTTLGNFNSKVISSTVDATNKAGIFLLDAAFSFTGASSGIFGEYAESDFSTRKIYQGIGHYDKSSNFIIAAEFESPRDNLNARNAFEEGAFNRRFSAGAAVGYAGEAVGASVGYKRIENKLNAEFDSIDFKKSIINSDNILGSVYINLSKFYLALSGGYYYNLKIAGVNHVGASALISYRLSKLRTYAGYQLLYAGNIHKYGSIYGMADNKDYSFDQSVAVFGLSYEAFTGFMMGIEHSNDIRTKLQRQSSLLNNSNNDITAVYLKYSF